MQPPPKKVKSAANTKEPEDPEDCNYDHILDDSRMKEMKKGIFMFIKEENEEKEEDPSPASMPYHRPIDGRSDDVHVFEQRAMDRTTHQLSWHAGDHAMHGVIGYVIWCFYDLYVFTGPSRAFCMHFKLD